MLFLTGATGFVGRHLVAALLQQGHTVKCLVRPGSGSKLPASANLVPVVGDVTAKDSLAPALEGAEAAIHLVGIIAEVGRNTFRAVHVEGTRNLVDACKALGVSRFLHMSALGAREDGLSEYHRTKWQAEEYVRRSGLTYTIFRPSLIHGPDGEFMRMAVKMVRSPLPAPIPGRGRALFQPVYVRDVARLFVEALANEKSFNKTYEVGGPNQMTYPQMLDQISEVLRGRPKAKVYLPLGLLRPAAALMEKVLRRPPLTRDQLKMLGEDNICALGPLLADFGWSPSRFLDCLNSYAHQL